MRALRWPGACLLILAAAWRIWVLSEAAFWVITGALVVGTVWAFRAIHTRPSWRDREQQDDQ